MLLLLSIKMHLSIYPVKLFHQRESSLLMYVFSEGALALNSTERWGNYLAQLYSLECLRSKCAVHSKRVNLYFFKGGGGILLLPIVFGVTFL